jgi:outer membrane lipoprotein-sorting protein
MQNHNARFWATNARLAIPLALSIILPVATACHIVKKPVEVEKLLTPLAEANSIQLIAAVNNLVAVRSIHGRVDIQFEDTSFATSGIAEKYRTADGSVTLQRPGKVYLIVQGPFATDVAQMTSDGEHFRIAILKGDEKYRRFVRGTNNAVYPRLEVDGSADSGKKGKSNSEAQTVNALSNLRPQHLTDALLLNPIDSHAAGLIYAQSEFFESEKDTSQPNSKRRVVRGYYFLDELQPAGDGAARLLRRFWFDRVNGIRLARLQTFDAKGALVTDVTYGELRKFGTEGNVLLPAQVSLTRPQDHYKITITYQAPDAANLDRDYPAEAFVLENKWGLKEADLDAEKQPVPPKN